MGQRLTLLVVNRSWPPLPSASLSVDSRDNQLDELSSQPLSPPAPSSSDYDSLDGATVDSVGLNSPFPRDTSVINLPNVDGVAKEGGTGVLHKLKTKVGLTKKEHKEKAISTKESYISVNNLRQPLWPACYSWLVVCQN